MKGERVVKHMRYYSNLKPNTGDISRVINNMMINHQPNAQRFKSIQKIL